MATKTCPSCQEEVPTAAPRCKHCFHDFTEAPPKKSGGPIALLGMLAVMALIAAGVFWLKGQRPGAESVMVDAETSSITFVTKYKDRTETDRVQFSEVANVEYAIGGSSQYEIAVVTLSGERWVLESSESKPLNGQAEHYAAVIDKPLVEKNEVRGFGDLGSGGQ